MLDETLGGNSVTDQEMDFNLSVTGLRPYLEVVNYFSLILIVIIRLTLFVIIIITVLNSNTVLRVQFNTWIVCTYTIFLQCNF